MAEPREPAPSGWELAFDATVAVGAAAGAVYEMAKWSFTQTVAPGRVSRNFSRHFRTRPPLITSASPISHHAYVAFRRGWHFA
jgi:hypothetical protein